MAEMTCCCSVILLGSIALNILLLTDLYKNLGGLQLNKHKLISWTQKAAEEAEAVALISCSGHGNAYLDGLVVDGKSICECNTCYGGPDCSLFIPGCAANADGGDPLFLEPFWKQHASSSAVVLSGWHRMSYIFPDHSYISQELINHILRVHAIAKNAVTKGRYIVFGTGSTQLLNAAVFALSMNVSSAASVVAEAPYFPIYKSQTEYFETARFEFKGNALLVKDACDTNTNLIEFVTSPNNPDSHLRKAVLQGPCVKTIYDHAYYWPHYTPIPAPADEDLMLFTISKLTGHAGSRFGWALVKDKQIYENMLVYIYLAEAGVSRDTQLRALQLLKTVVQGNGTDIFHFAYERMRDRWEKINKIISLSTRFTLQEIPPLFCNFFEKVRGPSPAYAWLKCERAEDANCGSVLRAANIIGRNGSMFGSTDNYVRLSLLRTQDEFNLLLHSLTDLVAQESGA